MTEPSEGPVAGPVLPPPLPEPEPSRKGRNWLLIGTAAATAVVLVGLAVVVPMALEAYRVVTAPTLEDVKVYDSVRAEHTGSEVEYDPAPSPGGPHDDAWQECGVYDEPVRDENAVHSLEHGTVWITYDPDEVDADGASELAEQLPEEGILSPYPGQAAPVILTVWQRQLELVDTDDPRIRLFVQEYGDGHTAPEPMASCAGGVERFESEDEGSGGVDI